MPLKIYYSDRIEDLAQELKIRLLEEKKGRDPFAFPQVIVPNANIAKWLQIRVFAKERELCAGIRFPFIERRLTELMSENLPEGTTFSLLPDNAYAGAVMAALVAKKDTLKEFNALAPLRAYIAGDDGSGELEVSTQRQARMAWQLAVKTADLMDQYEVRRPEIVEKWLAADVPPEGSSGRSEGMENEVEAAEAALARILWGPEGVFPPNGERLSLRQLYDRVCNAPPKGPRRTVCFFGHSTLSLLQVKILVWLARTHDVVFYHNNVCLEYWGDIETKPERIRKLGRAQAEKEDIDGIENPLLRQWGVAGRETMRLLVELEEENDGRIEFEWECVADPGRVRPDTVLGRIQESVCRRTSEVERVRQDASLQVVGVPGIRREVEMVYNAILGSVWKPDGSGERPWSDCGFSDIAVLVPDMAAYRPVIEAVFDARGEVPYGLIDTTASQDSKFLAGFAALADLARRGLTRETLFAVLDNPCVQAALKFSAEDVADWRNLTAAIGAFDGFEGRDDDSRSSWDWALSRLRLARVADRLSVVGESDADIPLVGKGGATALQFSAVVELLYRKTEAAFRDGDERRLLPCAVGLSRGADRKPNWADVLTRLMNDFLAVPDDSLLEGGVQRQIVQVLNSLAVLPGRHDCEVALAAVEQFVGGISCRKGGYLTHGVTVAGLQPMRPVPFKQVFVLGLGANGFPGRTGSTTLDVRGAGWRLGDTALPKVNRYLFLETLMSVRERLVLSYQNRDIEKDAELFPAGIVRELEDFVSSAVITGPFAEFKGYPLLERGEAGEDGLSPVCDVTWRKDCPFSGILPTYSKIARRLARERMGAELSSWWKNPQSSGIRNNAASVREVSAQELAEFLKSPLRAVLNRRLGVAVEGYRDMELQPDPALGVSYGPVQWNLESAILDEKAGLDREFRRMQLAGELPTGFIGAFAREKFRAASADSLEALRAFAATFGVNGAKPPVSRQSVLSDVTLADGSRAKVRYVAETPDWVETDEGVSVLATGWLLGQGGGDLKEDAIPVDRTLAPFIAFLMSMAGRSGEDAETPRLLRVGVVDVANGKTAVWNWTVSPDEAGNYLKRLVARYLDYLEAAKSPEGYADFTYRKLARALEGCQAGDWDGILAQLTKEEWKSGSKKVGFNNALVVEQSVAVYRRDPAADELKALYEEFYLLPMSGRLADDKKGAAE